MREHDLKNRGTMLGKGTTNTWAGDGVGEGDDFETGERQRRILVEQRRARYRGLEKYGRWHCVDDR